MDVIPVIITIVCARGCEAVLNSMFQKCFCFIFIDKLS